MAVNGGGGPLGLGGANPGAYSGCGHGGMAVRCYQQLARVYIRAGEIRGSVEQNQLKIEKYVKEIASLLADAAQATGKMFEE